MFKNADKSLMFKSVNKGLWIASGNPGKTVQFTGQLKGSLIDILRKNGVAVSLQRHGDQWFTFVTF
jgi:hypothetical protein